MHTLHVQLSEIAMCELELLKHWDQTTIIMHPAIFVSCTGRWQFRDEGSPAKVPLQSKHEEEDWHGEMQQLQTWALNLMSAPMQQLIHSACMHDALQIPMTVFAAYVTVPVQCIVHRDCKGRWPLDVSCSNALTAATKNELISFKHFPSSCMLQIAGGSGITPMLQVASEILSNPEDKTQVSLIFANQTEQDIILRDEIDQLASKHENFQVTSHFWLMTSWHHMLFQLCCNGVFLECCLIFLLRYLHEDQCHSR